MKGYWNQPEATAKALRPGQVPGEMVLHTGDLFRTDEDNFLYFVDRKDDVIKVRGEKVSPRHIEEVIARLPGVAEVAVYAIPDDVSGEAIAAAVTTIEGTVLTPERIQRHCLEHLEAYMVPKVVDIRNTLPTTTSGKVSRRALRLTARPVGESAA
jgi:acyl-CoA synthetase (AMP-forming)/AMP-acid ligase II